MRDLLFLERDKRLVSPCKGGGPETSTTRELDLPGGKRVRRGYKLGKCLRVSNVLPLLRSGGTFKYKY